MAYTTEVDEYEFLCSLCNNIFSDPRLLPCLHTFCFKCVDKYIKTSEVTTATDCPQCHLTFTLPDSGVAGLSCNSFVERLIQVTSKHHSGACDNCIVKDATFDFYCSECRLKLCSTCVEWHRKTKRTTNHKIVERSLLSTNQLQDIVKNIVVYCTLHTNERISMYCSTCGKFVCVVCKAGTHETHKCLGLEEMSNAAEKDYKDRIELIQQKSSLSQKLLSDVDEFIKNRNNNVKEILNQIDEAVQLVIERVTKDGITLKKEVIEIANQKNKSVLHVKAEIQHLQSTLEVLIKTIDDLNKFGSLMDIISMSDKLKTRAEELLTINLPLLPNEYVITFSEKEKENKSKSITKNQIGSVAVENVESTLIPEKEHEVSVGSAVYGVAIHNNCLYAVVEYSKFIRVYSADKMTFIRSVEVKGLNTPSDIVVGCHPEARLFVSDFATKTIFKTRLTGAKLKSWAVKGYPQSLSFDYRGHIVVCCKDKKAVRIYNIEGVLLHVIHLPLVPLHCLQIDESTLIVSTEHKVLKYSHTTNQVMNIFGPDQSHYSRLYWPIHLLTNSQRQILVTDLNKVILLSKNLNFVKQLLTKPLTQLPSRICLDESNKLLYVGERTGNIKAFKLP